MLKKSAILCLLLHVQPTQMQPRHCGRMRALRCLTTMQQRSSHIWAISTRMCALQRLTAWPLLSRCAACGQPSCHAYGFADAPVDTGSGPDSARMLQEHPSSAGSALDHLTAGYAGAGIKARNGTAQALRALAPLLGQPQVQSSFMVSSAVKSSMPLSPQMPMLLFCSILL